METNVNQNTEEGSSMSVEVWLRKDNRFRDLSPIDYLFKKLAGLYPKRWVEQFRTNEELQDWKVCWAEELAERGIKFDEVKRGLNRCIELYDWPPSFPEFIKACRPALDYEVAFYEAVEQMHKRKQGKDRWSNPAIYWAATKLGGDIMGAVYVNVKTRWKAALDEAIHNVESGISPREVPKRPVLLEHKTSTIKSPVALAELEKIKAILEIKPRWKRELQERTGMNVKSSDSGALKPVSDFLGNAVNE